MNQGSQELNGCFEADYGNVIEFHFSPIFRMAFLVQVSLNETGRKFCTNLCIN